MAAALEIKIPARYCGPAESGNGGYSCGVLAAYVDSDQAVAVTLRQPPPLDTPLQLRRVGGQAQLFDGERLIAEAEPAPLELQVPAAPTLAEAEAAAQRYPGHHRHAFPHCFVCGPARQAGDGLRIFSGPLQDRALVAAPWQPDAGLAGPGGMVKTEYLWAAIDCPGAWAVLPELNTAVVLGRLTARIHGQLGADETAVVCGWRLSSEGRKHQVGTALFAADGRLIASAKAIWIALKST